MQWGINYTGVLARRDINHVSAYATETLCRVIVTLKIEENRYKQKISTDPYFGCYRYAVFITQF